MAGSRKGEAAERNWDGRMGRMWGREKGGGRDRALWGVWLVNWLGSGVIQRTKGSAGDNMFVNMSILKHPGGVCMKMSFSQLEIWKWNLGIWIWKPQRHGKKTKINKKTTQPDIQRMRGRKHNSYMCHECLSAFVCFVCDKGPQLDSNSGRNE